MDSSRPLNRRFLRDALFFAVCVLVVHVLWKLLLRPYADAGRSGEGVWFCGCDATGFFDWWCAWQSSVSAWLVGLFEPVWRHGNDLLGGPNPVRISVVWSCSGLKQALMLLLALLTAGGPWRHKAWYLPLAVTVCFLFNCLRIALIAGVSFVDFGWFNPLHQSMKYVFYLLLFGLWVLWEEKFVLHEPAA